MGLDDLGQKEKRFVAEGIVIALGLSFLAWHHLIQQELVAWYEARKHRQRLEDYVSYQERQH